jgi:hypothetical protein
MEIMNGELKRMWNEEVMVYSEELSQNLPGGTEETMMNLIQHFHILGLEWNLGSPEYEAGVPTPQP